MIYSALFCIDWIREIVIRMTVTVKWENFQESTQGLVINLLEQEKLLLRFCPCYCVNFLIDDELNCLNKDWLDKWKGVPILREATAATTRQGSEIQVLDHNLALQIVDLAGKDSTVALLLPNERFLMVSENFTDDYQCHYYWGSKILQGHFYTYRIRYTIYDLYVWKCVHHVLKTSYNILSHCC